MVIFTSVQDVVVPFPGGKVDKKTIRSPGNDRELPNTGSLLWGSDGITSTGPGQNEEFSLSRKHYQTSI